MFGLIVIAVFAVYLAVSIFVVRLVARKAKAKGRSAKRWGIAAALLMYLLVFWDHIPTLVLHHYYCATKAGFWVYKTPEQWMAENPGVAETLTWREVSPSFHNPDGSWGFRVNERFIWKHEQQKAVVLPVFLDIESIVDMKNEEILVKRVSVWSGYGSLALGGKDWRVLKFWVASETYIPSIREFGQYQDMYKRIGREAK